MTRGGGRLALLVPLVLLTLAADPPPFEVREEAYRFNNRGVALLEQYRYDDAAASFRRALEVDPALHMARLNLGIALFNASDLAGASVEIQAAGEHMKTLGVPFLRGLIAKAQGRTDDAVREFRRVQEEDPGDVGANVNLGQAYLQLQRYPEAIRCFRAAVDAESFNATAVYNLGIALVRAGQGEEGQKVLARFQALKAAGFATVLGLQYPEQGRYAQAVVSTGAEEDRVEVATPRVRFEESRIPWEEPRSEGLGPAEPWKRDLIRRLPARATLFDFDGDGKLDLFVVSPAGQRLFRNEGSGFVDVTRQVGLDPAQGGFGAVAGDYDNDSREDLFVLRYKGGTLYHNDSGQRLTDVTATAGIAPDPSVAVAAAFVDADHDGNLDLFIAGFVDLEQKPPAKAGAVFPDDYPGETNRLLRNNGNGTFTDVTAKAGLAGTSRHAVAVVPTDFDNHRDVDLLVANHDGAVNLFKNLRDGTFRDVAAEVGLGSITRVSSVTAGDLNKDGFVDFFFGRPKLPGVLALSDGKERFTLAPGPEGSDDATASQFLDYDNDGLLDLLILKPGTARLLRNVGRGFADASEALPNGSAARALAVADLDLDGAEDLLVVEASGAPHLWLNRGEKKNASLPVRLTSRVSNRSSVQAKVEILSGSLRGRLETYSATPPPAPNDILFGLGRRHEVDAVRVLWPSGILQSESEIPPGKGLALTELDRKPSSCPFLYAWNGRGFSFVTDFLGGGEMGDWVGPGTYDAPVPEEYVRIRDDQLVERAGELELRVTNELEETLFLDRLKLLAVSHPADVEVYANEGLRPPPRKPLKLLTTRGARPPVSAVDETGTDVLEKVSRLDRRYADTFRLLGIRGYAEPHVLTLDLGIDPSTPVSLLLTGFTDYAFSSDNVAASHAGLALLPPSLEVLDGAGEWRTVVPNLGIPVGRPQTIAVDLEGLWRSPRRSVRIVTNMRVYWDQILVDTSGGLAPTDVRSLELGSAILRERGFSEARSPGGTPPEGYDYDAVTRSSPWKSMTGTFTRLGDVRELLAASDDNFVISRPGDEIAVSFPASSLPPLPKGWRRTYFLYADGFSKEMDINSASPDAVLPLPFHAMSRYPYRAPEAFPMTAERRELFDRYQTRLVRSQIPPLESLGGEVRKARQK